MGCTCHHSLNPSTIQWPGMLMSEHVQVTDVKKMVSIDRDFRSNEKKMLLYMNNGSIITARRPVRGILKLGGTNHYVIYV